MTDNDTIAAAFQWSLEMLPAEAPSLHELRGVLAPGTRIYLPWLPRQDFALLLSALVRVRECGFEPVPHLAARRIDGEVNLGALIEDMVMSAGVRRVLLVAGDAAQPMGPYRDSAALLESRVLSRAGIAEVGFAGHPEGHLHLASARLQAALLRKVKMTREQGQQPFIVTQFSFAPARVVAYAAQLAHALHGTAVYVGVAGPTDPIKLLRYARLCGVNASRSALSQLGTGIARLAMHTDPAEHIAAVTQQQRRGASHIAGVHLFSFGGLVHTARWLAGLRANARPASSEATA